jgi:hypothetical protein
MVSYVDYKLVETRYRDRLEKEVTKLLLQHYVPFGSVKIETLSTSPKDDDRPRHIYRQVLILPTRVSGSKP